MRGVPAMGLAAFDYLDEVLTDEVGENCNTLKSKPTTAQVWVDTADGNRLCIRRRKGRLSKEIAARMLTLRAWETANGKHPERNGLYRRFVNAMRASRPTKYWDHKTPLNEWEKVAAGKKKHGTEKKKRSAQDTQESLPRGVLDTPPSADDGTGVTSVDDGTLAARGVIRDMAASPDADKLMLQKFTEQGAKEDYRRQKSALAKGALDGLPHEEVLAKLSEPERVIESLRDAGYSRYERVAGLVSITRDPGARDSDRMAAYRELEEVIKETARDMGVSVGAVQRALATGDWNPMAERSLAERVAAGDLEAIRIAIKSDKVTSLADPDKIAPSVAVLNVNGAQYQLTEAQQKRLAALDELLVLPEERKIVSSQVVSNEEDDEVNVEAPSTESEDVS